MTAAKHQILARIRAASQESAAADTAATDYAALPRDYRQSADLTPSRIVALLTERLRDYGAGVHLCDNSEQIPATVAYVLRLRQKHRLAIPSGLPAEWLPQADAQADAFDFVPEDFLPYAQLEQFDGAITACSAAIAETGTIVLAHSDREGRRALTLLPDFHLCILFASQIYQTVPQAMRVLDALPSKLLTTISGPSATSDIEMIRVQGVHGPRTLDVIICGS